MLIHVLLIWLLLSVKFSVSSSTSLRNSLISSSHLFLGFPIALLVLYFELSSVFHSTAFHQPSLTLFSAPVSISFFCESCSSIESSHFPSFLWHRSCFFLCSRSNLLLQSLWYQFLLQNRSRNTRRCPGLCECLSFARLHFRRQWYSSRWCFLFVSSYLFVSLFCCIFLFVCMMRRSILRCVDCVILSCSLVGVHVPDA